ncbi:MAG: Y-family DNA polymerase, partial [Duncaniella sp.]|nr:Y-family DNA polymerase [Duncaniella sp.]
MVGLVDCDNFFCSCERVFRPDLDGKPVVVLSNNDGCVVARSAEVKAMGVREGLPYYQLRELYPNAGITAFSSNYELYGDMSARVMSILAEEAPAISQYSIDEAFLDLDGIPTETLRPWGERLCAYVERCTGIPVSLGIAPTRTLAKVASRFAKRYPGYHKCCIIADDTARRKALSLLPVGDVWGIGRRMRKVIQTMGARTALDFAEWPRELVRTRFHVTGERTWDELNGRSVLDTDDIETMTKKSILTSRSFPGMLTALADINIHVANFAGRCAIKLRRQHSVCSMLTVFVQSNRFRQDLEQYDGSASTTFATPTASTIEIVRASATILRAIYRSGIRYKRAGVMVSGISSDTAVQPDLFDYD